MLREEVDGAIGAAVAIGEFGRNPLICNQLYVSSPHRQAAPDDRLTVDLYPFPHLY